MIKRTTLSLAATLAVSAFLPFASAAETATITIEQVSPTRLGSWTLIYPEGNVKSTDPGITARKHTLYPKAGTMLLTFQPPAGNSTRVNVYENGELTKTVSLPQISVEVEAGKEYKFLAQYTFDKMGTIGVTSDPSGQRFQLIGPDRKVYRGMTPKTFSNVPAGNYRLRMNAIRDCIRPRLQNIKLEANEREVVHIDYDCDTTTDEVVERGPSKRSIRDAAAAREAARALRRRGN